MSRKTVVLENVDMELLSQQKRDLLDMIADHRKQFTYGWKCSMSNMMRKNFYRLESLDGLLHLIDYIEDKVEKG